MPPMNPDEILLGPPPQPSMQTATRPSFMGLAPQPSPATPGASQIGSMAIKLSMEIDQALKLLAQQVPQLAPWVEKTVLELRSQVSSALQAGIDVSVMPQGNAAFPGGGGNL